MSGISTDHPIALIKSGRGIDIETYKSELDCVMQLLNNGRLGHALGYCGWGGPQHKEALAMVVKHIGEVNVAIAKMEAEDAEITASGTQS